MSLASMNMQPTPEPIWIQIARKELGVHEIAGPHANERILDYGKHTGLAPSSDEVPWCAIFGNYVLDEARKVDPRIYEPTHSAMAKSFLHYGEELVGPRLDCIAILNRGNDPHSGHFTFVIGFDAQLIHCLGGNQGDAVSIAKFPRDRVAAYRWPLKETP